MNIEKLNKELEELEKKKQELLDKKETALKNSSVEKRIGSIINDALSKVENSICNPNGKRAFVLDSHPTTYMRGDFNFFEITHRLKIVPFPSVHSTPTGIFIYLKVGVHLTHGQEISKINFSTACKFNNLSDDFEYNNGVGTSVFGEEPIYTCKYEGIEEGDLYWDIKNEMIDIITNVLPDKINGYTDDLSDLRCQMASIRDALYDLTS